MFAINDFLTAHPEVDNVKVKTSGDSERGVDITFTILVAGKYRWEPTPKRIVLNEREHYKLTEWADSKDARRFAKFSTSKTYSSAEDAFLEALYTGYYVSVLNTPVRRSLAGFLDTISRGSWVKI